MSSAITNMNLSPGVLSLLPLFYVGWSDSVLSPEEIKLIHTRIQRLNFLNDNEKEQLIAWTNPNNPPDSSIFKFWQNEIYRHAEMLSQEQKGNLISLGIEMAKLHSSKPDPKIWNDEQTQNALREIEDALGVSGMASASSLLSFLGPRIQTDANQLKVNPFEIGGILNASYADTGKMVKNWLATSITSDYSIDKNLYRINTLENLKKLAAFGLGTYAFPPQYGGKNKLDHHIAIFEHLAYGDLSLTVKFGVQFGLFGGSILRLGNESHHKKYLRKMMEAKLLGCFAMTETAHGSNVKKIETTAIYLPESKELEIHSPSPHSIKDYIGNALHAHMAIVFAQLIVDNQNQGVHAILVELRSPEGVLNEGIYVEDCGYKMGLNGVDNGRIRFNRVRVPYTNLLDKYGGINSSGNYESTIDNAYKRFFTMIGSLVMGRISVGLASVSASKKSLCIAINYALKRRQFGSDTTQEESLIMDYATHQKRLIPQLARAYAYHFALRDLLVDIDSPKDVRLHETLAAGLKAKASWFCTQTIQISREACGGKGYLYENQFASLKADTEIFTTFEGDNTVLMQLVGKNLLSNFKDSLHEEGNMRIISYVLKKASLSIKEINPIQKRRTESAFLTSAEYIRETLDYRYQKILLSLAGRIQKYLKRRIDPFQIFLKVQLHMIDLADAYIDLIVFNSFNNNIAQTEKEHAVKWMRTLLSLYGLSQIDDNKGWYLENNYMEPGQSKAIRRNISKIYQELRPQLAGLVEAFEIPEKLLKAPIALY